MGLHHLRPQEEGSASVYDERNRRAFEGLFQNLEVPGLTWALRGPVSWLARLNPIGHGPSDRTGGKVAWTCKGYPVNAMPPTCGGR